MFLSKEEFIFIIAIAAGVPLLFIGFVTYLLIHQNIQRKKKQIEIRDAMLATQENERKRIAEDLHDQVGSFLTGIKLQISFDDNTPTEKILRNLTRARLDLDKTMEEIRTITHNLFSSDITSIGLVATLHQTVNQLRNSKMKIDLECAFDDREFPYEFQTNIYRICLELLSNSIKHSIGDAIRLSLNKSNHSIILTYTDNGKAQEKSSGIGIGLQNLKNRIQLLNGKVLQFSEEFSEGANYKVLFNY